MFSHLKSKQKSMSGFVNPGFHNLVKLNNDKKKKYRNLWRTPL